MPTGGLAGIDKKYSPIDLQSRFLYPQGRRQMVQRTVTVKLPSGQQFEGRLLHLDEFDVAMRDANGHYHSWPRPAVEVTVPHPPPPHRALLQPYPPAHPPTPL